LTKDARAPATALVEGIAKTAAMAVPRGPIKAKHGMADSALTVR